MFFLPRHVPLLLPVKFSSAQRSQSICTRNFPPNCRASASRTIANGACGLKSGRRCLLLPPRCINYCTSSVLVVHLLPEVYVDDKGAGAKDVMPVETLLPQGFLRAPYRPARKNLVHCASSFEPIYESGMPVSWLPTGISRRLLCNRMLCENAVMTVVISIQHELLQSAILD